MASLHEIKADLEQLADACDLTQHGLGVDLLDTIAVGIMERSIGEQKAPSGAPWAPNKEPYASSPKKRGKPIGVLTGEMLSQEQLRGEQTIEPERASMRYGVSPEAQQKLDWFTKGKPARYSRDVRGRFIKGTRVEGTQPRRPVYGLDDEIRAALDAKIREHIDKVVAELK